MSEMRDVSGELLPKGCASSRLADDNGLWIVSFEDYPHWVGGPLHE
jgi:hypothetical protein